MNTAPHTKKRLFGSVPVLIFVLGLIASTLTFNVMRTQEKESLQQVFDVEVSKLTGLIQDRMSDYVQVLQGGKALFNASTSVERDEWEQYYAALDLHSTLPGIQGFAYSIYLPDEEAINSIVTQIRQEGFEDFQVRPDPIGRQEVHSIIFIQPFDDRNKQAFGFDMSSERTRREAMHSARDSGEPRLSGHVTLLQEITEDVQAGALLYVPVYTNGAAIDTVTRRRQHLEGFVYAAFRMGDLFNSIPLEANGVDLEFAVFDHEHSESEQKVIFKTKTFDERTNPLFEARVGLEVVGRKWHLHIASPQVFGATYDKHTSTIVFWTGTFLSMIVAIIFYMGSKTQSRAYKIADSMTAALKKTQKRLKSIYSISSTTSLSIEDQLNEMLMKGCEQFGMEMGIISRIEDDVYTVQYAVSVEGNPPESGTQFALGNTYCSLVLEEDDVVAIDHTKMSLYKDHPCYKEHQLESYIGIKLMVNGKAYGTVNFSSMHKKKHPFGEEDFEFIRLITKFIAAELGRQSTLDSIEKQRDELKRVNELMVGREIKMKELKKKLKNNPSDSTNDADADT